MNIEEVKDLMMQFDESSLREFSFKTETSELSFSKNEYRFQQAALSDTQATVTPLSQNQGTEEISSVPMDSQMETSKETLVTVEGKLVESPLVGVAYLGSSPEKGTFVSLGETVKKGQTLLIIEAMKVMNEVPAPCDGVVTEILVDNEEVVEFGKGLVRIK